MHTCQIKKKKLKLTTPEQGTNKCALWVFVTDDDKNLS